MRLQLFIALVFLLSGCASAPEKSNSTVPISKEQEAAIVSDLVHGLESKYGAWKDGVIENSLSVLIIKLSAKNESFRSKPLQRSVRIHLLATPLPIVSAAPGGLIFISRGALKSIQYENELAFILAAPLAMIRDEIPQKRIEKPSVGWFEPAGLFDYGFDAYLKADREAVQMLHEVKFDHRGAISLMKRWNSPEYASQWNSYWKLTPELIERYDAVRDEAAKLTPNRDSVLNSKAFDELKLRIKKSDARKNTR